MLALSRRRNKKCDLESWLIYFGDVRVGTIGLRSGVPSNVDQWGWSCGFHPGTEPGDFRQGSAATFEEARSEFERAWRQLAATRTEADFQAWRNQRGWTAWKYRMFDAGLRMPTQMPDGRSTCFCGAAIGIADVEAHVLAVHNEQVRC